MKYFNEYFQQNDVVFQLSKHSNKPVMFIESTGLKDCEDLTKVEEVWDFYLGKCNIDIYNCLRQFGHAYCYFDTEEQAKNAFEEWFPNYGDLMDDEKHFYFHQHLVFYEKNLNITNE
jgi:hypothetical protein